MRFIVLLFGAAGFTLVMITGYLAGRQPDLVLRDAALGCLGSAFLGRWFGQVLHQAFAHALAAKEAEHRATQEKAEAARTAAAPNATTNRARPAPMPAPVAARGATPTLPAMTGETRPGNLSKVSTP